MYGELPSILQGAGTRETGLTAEQVTRLQAAGIPVATPNLVASSVSVGNIFPIALGVGVALLLASGSKGRSLW